FPPFVRARFAATVGAPPVHVSVMSNSVNPRTDGRTSGERRESPPHATERFLCEIGGIGVVAAEPAQIGINSLIKQFDKLTRRRQVALACALYQPVRGLRV